MLQSSKTSSAIVIDVSESCESAALPVNSFTRYEPILRKEMPELDAIRGIAILLVVLYHGFFWTAGRNEFTGITKAFVAATMPGWMGVNLFFVLSGFLITGILLDSKTSRDYFRSFYTKRALRILPAYFGILLVLFVVGTRPRSFLVLSVFFLSNLTPIFGIAMAYPALWSLAVEEHFYLVWPSLVRVCSIRRLEQCAIGIVCLVPALRAVSFLLGHTAGIHGYTWFEADGLVAGAWLAISARKPEFTREKLAWIASTAMGVALFAVLAGARFGILSRERVLGASLQESCGNLFFLGVVSLFLLVGTSKWKSLVRRPILRFYGYISYGLYLIHLLVFDVYARYIYAIWPAFPSPQEHFSVLVLGFALCLSVSTGLAFLSRKYFEEPFLQMRRRFLRDARPAAIDSHAK